MVKNTFISFLLLLVPVFALPMDLKQELDLEGEWRFEIGDDLSYALPDFNHSDWETIQVPNAWENEGFPGYDGFAWYRKSFELNSSIDNRHLYLKLGRIDDTDAVYLNGVLIGQNGSFPPEYRGAWNVKRIYKIPPEVIRHHRENIIAIRVYDGHEAGGITHGNVGLYSRVDVINMAIDLSGNWYFHPGDNSEWSDPNIDLADWKQINVPAKWERQGYPDLDHFAWYRKSVTISRKLAQEKLILLLGKINDLDQVFFNGELIGETGEMPQWDDDDNEWRW
ncbi:MAG: glycoside hydrolase, partial [Candidatus Marinimicrobia bacterium]|nr:glycoside hydrolase [Candidatus Neomarinimicrobiota bacterium]